MARSQISIRLDNEKKNNLVNLARIHNKKYGDLVREKIDELLTNETPEETKGRVRKIIREINAPFFFFKTAQGKKYAKEELARRKYITQKLRETFNLN